MTRGTINIRDTGVREHDWFDKFLNDIRELRERPLREDVIIHQDFLGMGRGYLN